MKEVLQLDIKKSFFSPKNFLKSKG